jgi:hypothetical protein
MRGIVAAPVFVLIDPMCLIYPPHAVVVDVVVEFDVVDVVDVRARHSGQPLHG